MSTAAETVEIRFRPRPEPAGQGQESYRRPASLSSAHPSGASLPWSASGRSFGVMGVVNVTPDSFFAASRSTERELGDRLARLVDEGADVLDIGGESTRPGAHPVSTEEELTRILPAVREAAQRWPRKPVSIDTYKAGVAAEAITAGASIVNDISGGSLDGAMPALVAEREVTVIIGHTRGTPQTMAGNATYDDVVEEVYNELARRVEVFCAAGVSRARIWIDPGIGFAKRAEASRTLLFHLDRFREMGLPLVVGLSRKSFLGEALSGAGIDAGGAEARLEASLAAAVLAAERGAVLIRTHDVGPTRRALAVLEGGWV